ncbi:MAG: flagellar basal body rod protein FlgC [Deltaproteobacteria bacterium]|nr:flagellar basal body rod protein FlgC [Deltaproteobacteria bacterium]
MNLFKMFSISGAGMAAQRNRMSVITGNLANTETTRTAEGGPYRRRDIIFQAVPVNGDFADLLSERFFEGPEGLSSVEVAGIRQSGRPPRQIFDPKHPDANPDGYVSLPDINVIEEMVDLMSAVRSYEANLTAYNTTKGLVRRILEIGRNL